MTICAYRCESLLLSSCPLAAFLALHPTSCDSPRVCSLLSSVYQAALHVLHRRLMSHEWEMDQKGPALRSNRSRSLHWAAPLFAPMLPLSLWWRRTCIGSQPIFSLSFLNQIPTTWPVSIHFLLPRIFLSLWGGRVVTIYESLFYTCPNHFFPSVDSSC